MRKTERHGGQVLGVQPFEQARELLSDSSVEIHRRRVGNDLDAQLLGNRATQLGVSDDEGLLDASGLFGLLAVGDLVDEELGEDLGELAFLELGQVLDGVGGRRESVDSLKLEAGGMIIERDLERAKTTKQDGERAERR